MSKPKCDSFIVYIRGTLISVYDVKSGKRHMHTHFYKINITINIFICICVKHNFQLIGWYIESHFLEHNDISCQRR